MNTTSFMNVLGIVAPIINNVLPLIVKKDESESNNSYVDTVKQIGEKVGLKLDTQHAEAAIKIAEELVLAASDGTVTVSEVIKVVEDLCSELGVNFDKTGIQLTDHGVDVVK